MIRFIFTGLLGLWCAMAAAQKMTIVKGLIIDAETKEPLPLVNISFVGTTIGTTTELDGTYLLESKWATDAIQISYVGYETQTIPIVPGERQEIHVSLQPSSLRIQTVEVKAKKRRYKRKDNPAVELMKNVIAHKDQNRIEIIDFYEYDKYEKIQLDLNNFDPEKARSRRMFKKFNFLFNYVDTSELNGKPYLPFFIQEIISKVYYRKNPESLKEHRQGVKVTGMKEYVDSEDLTKMLDILYEEVDIFKDNVRLLDLNFVSPIASFANTFYRYYIMDSMAMVNGHPCIKVSFFPENNQNIAFRGDLYILKDSSYAVVKADLGITRQINVNFVRDFRLEQVFEKKDSIWVLSKDRLIMDFSPFKRSTGFFGTRTVSRRGYIFNQPREDEKYAGTEKILYAPKAYEQNEAYWKAARHDTLSTKEQNIYLMVETLRQTPAFKRLTSLLTLLFTGYKAAGSVDIGPISTFNSFNPVEGYRLKFSGETNLKFHPKISLGAYLAYGFRDQQWKYGGYALYSFQEDFKKNPRHFLRFSYLHDVNVVGRALQFSRPDNLFYSFQRGTNDRMFFADRVRGEYFLEFANHFSVEAAFTHNNMRPIGSLKLEYTEPNSQEPALRSQIRTTEAELNLRFAPNEKFIQGRSYRLPIYNRYPIIVLKMAAGFKDLLGGEVAYQSLKLNVTKRFYMSFMGTMRLEAEAGKYWGKEIPYFQLHLPRANQTYAYFVTAFNMMNYMEFVADEYVQLFAEHNFNGFFFNKVPLLRKLKLREVISFKMLYGGLSDGNNPNKRPELIQFLRNDQSQAFTSVPTEKPYMEASAEIGNIFKFLQVGIVRRLTYLDKPETPVLFGVKGLGIRFRFKMSF